MTQTQNTEVKYLANGPLLAQVRQLISEGHTVKLPVRGRSMRLFLEHDRDIALLAPVSPEAVSVRDVVLAEVGNDHYVLHRVIRREGDRLTLMGDGNVKGTEQCRASDVVALATGFYRKGRTRPDLVTGRKWRIYSALWLALKPFRRLILGLYRRSGLHI